MISNAAREPGKMACRLCDPTGAPSFRLTKMGRLSREYWEHMIRHHPLACERVQARFPGYIGGVLVLHTDHRAMGHLASCKNCKAALHSAEADIWPGSLFRVAVNAA